MTTYRHWSVSLRQDPDNVPYFRTLSPNKTEWWLISATLCRWRRCFTADQLWFMTRIHEEEAESSSGPIFHSRKLREITPPQRLPKFPKSTRTLIYIYMTVLDDLKSRNDWSSPHRSQRVSLKADGYEWCYTLLVVRARRDDYYNTYYYYYTCIYNAHTFSIVVLNQSK